MINIQSIESLRTQISQWRSKGETIAFVPTMGNLHQGHLSLVEIAKEKADHVVVSIYVNPLQFSPDEDYASYPRTLDDDLEKLEALAVDLAFMPDNSQLYATGEQESCFVEVPDLSHVIEGEFRPHFFRGVATVVLKLFNLVQPDIAVFGEKDFQQLLIIRQMVKDLCLPIEIIGGETRREADGLAMSSRNNYLTATERELSRFLLQTLLAARNQVEQGIAVRQVETNCTEALLAHGFLVDYVTIRETAELTEVTDEYLVNEAPPIETISNEAISSETISNEAIPNETQACEEVINKKPARNKPVANKKLAGNKELIILVAVKVGRTRLIDNVKFTIA